jgi:site-specific DNA recombinase
MKSIELAPEVKTKKVAIYTRSSKDLHNVSCEAQEDEIRNRLKEGEEICRVFSDKALSSINDVRPAFNEMISLATLKEPPFSAIYSLDTSRFGRDELQTKIMLHKLRRKHGIEVVFLNMPQTGTPIDERMESVISAFDQFYSQQSKIKGVAGMKQNVKDGYRAGGKAPYGYMLERIELGVVRNGKPVTKSKLVLDPDTAPIAQEYFKRRVKFESRKSILRDFYRRGIPSPNGRKNWPVATVKTWEDNIETYEGHTTFNRLNERVKVDGKLDGYLGGQKWKPEEEWERKKNTHERLITPEIADSIRQIKEKGVRETPRRAVRVFALSGLMTCSECGSNYTGDRTLYRCNYYNKAGLECHNNAVSQRRIEGAVFSLINEQVLNFRNIQKVVNRVKSRLQGENKDTSPLEKRLIQFDREMERLMLLYRRGKVDPFYLEGQMRQVKEQRVAVAEELKQAKESIQAFEVNEEVIQEVIDKLGDEVNNADPQIRKRALMALIDRVVIFPKKSGKEGRIIEVRGSCLPLTRIAMASPTRFELVSPA